MPSSEATVRSRGRVTIPAEVRRRMGLTPGTRVVFSLSSDGTFVVRAKTRSVSDLKGLLASARPDGESRRVAIDEMNIGRG